MLWPGIHVFSEEACPIAGEYTGVIPDNPSMCAKMYSDCRNPQRMFYRVANCNNLTEVYEGISRAPWIDRRTIF